MNHENLKRIAITAGRQTGKPSLLSSLIQLISKPFNDCFRGKFEAPASEDKLTGCYAPKVSSKTYRPRSARKNKNKKGK